MKPSFNLELELKTQNYELVFGMDEVGRGSFAGPLVASAVNFKELPNAKWVNEINDSKLLTSKKREQLSELILKNADCFTEIIDIETINELGIGKCNILIFEKLIKKIQEKYPETKQKLYYLIDGRNTFKSTNTKFIVRGDSQSISIAAASIIAKVFRDKLMADLGKMYVGYNFAKNKGYGTKFHQNAIKKLGLCGIHRKSFKLTQFL